MSSLPFDLPDLTEQEFEQFAALVYARTGISLKESKVTMLSNRLRRRLSALGLSSFKEYHEYLAREKNEVTHFVEAVTTNETYFWRSSVHFELIKESILPVLLERFKGEKLLFWSAACSTGEEPYNLAMELVESMKSVGFFDFRVIASDISQRVVSRAQEGIYSGRSIERIPEPVLRRYFREDPPESGKFSVRQDIRDRIEFRVENVFGAIFPAVHMILCRNLMIYFQRAEQEKLMLDFHRLLKPGGFVVLGHAESLPFADLPFHIRRFDKGPAHEKPLQG